jgi:hypothetical protein
MRAVGISGIARKTQAHIFKRFEFVFTPTQNMQSDDVNTSSKSAISCEEQTTVATVGITV